MTATKGQLHVLIIDAKDVNGTSRHLEHFPFRSPLPRIGEICGAFRTCDLVEARDDGLAQAVNLECDAFESIGGDLAQDGFEFGKELFDGVEVWAITTVEGASLPDDTWQLLDHRLYRSYWWPSWDKCRRILQTTVNMYMDREIDASFFLKITARDDVFAALVDTVANNYSGQRYLKSIKDRLTDGGAAVERIRLVK